MIKSAAIAEGLESLRLGLATIQSVRFQENDPQRCAYYEESDSTARRVRSNLSKEFDMRLRPILAFLLLLLTSACDTTGTNQGIPLALGRTAHSNRSAKVEPSADHTSILKMLKTQAVIGSTVDPANGDQNPYGLVYIKYKPFGKGVLKKGDLVVCNFNDQGNVQGNGTTVEYMPSTTGSSPTRLVQDSSLKGCASLVINGFDEVFATNSGAKNAVGIFPSGKITQTLQNSKLMVEPWGSVYITGIGYPPGDGLWVSDADSGKIVRIDLGTASGKPKYTPVISGFAVNHGKPGSILGPSGLQYVGGNTDTLYIADGVTNTLVAIRHPYSELFQANAIAVGSNGMTFSGPKAKDAKLLFHGYPLDGPISSTVLPNGNLVLGNTLNKNGKNLMVEIASDGTLLAYKNVDNGPAGAIFGIVATGASDSTTKIYFNDDNNNNVRVLQP